ncbi:hypothetical protein HK098_007528, partial [Nowakowskiella sp. JEL0407]
MDFGNFFFRVQRGQAEVCDFCRRAYFKIRELELELEKQEEANEVWSERLKVEKDFSAQMVMEYTREKRRVDELEEKMKFEHEQAIVVKEESKEGLKVERDQAIAELTTLKGELTTAKAENARLSRCLKIVGKFSAGAKF